MTSASSLIPIGAPTAISSTKASNHGVLNMISSTSSRSPIWPVSGNSRYNRPSEVIAHPHLMARDRWRSVDTPVGKISALRPPPVISGIRTADVRGPRAR